MEGFDLINLVLDILPWCASFISYFIGIKQEKKKNKRELIEKYYPDLIENLRVSVDEMNDDLRGIRIRNYMDRFDVLIEMNRDDTLRIIEEIDKDLSEYFSTILNLISDLENVGKGLSSKIHKISEEWGNTLQQMLLDAQSPENTFPLYFPAIDLNPQQFVSHISNSIIWYLYRETEDEARQEFDKRIRDINEGPRAEIPPDTAEKIYSEFSFIAVEEFNPIHEKYEKLHKQMIEIISDKVLPIMGDRMRNLVK